MRARLQPTYPLRSTPSSSGRSRRRRMIVIPPQVTSGSRRSPPPRDGQWIAVSGVSRRARRRRRSSRAPASTTTPLRPVLRGPLPLRHPSRRRTLLPRQPAGRRRIARAGRSPGLAAVAAVIVGGLALAGVFSRGSPTPTSAGTITTPARRTVSTPSTTTAAATVTQIVKTRTISTTVTDTAANTPSPAGAVVGDWHGTVTQFTPRGTQQQIEVRSAIRNDGATLAGNHSETTVAGQGTGQRCAGRLEETQEGSGSVTFAYTETLTASNCIAHTTITATPMSDGTLGYQETYQTSIGPGRLTGTLSQ